MNPQDRLRATAILEESGQPQFESWLRRLCSIDSELAARAFIAVEREQLIIAGSEDPDEDLASGEWGPEWERRLLASDAATFREFLVAYGFRSQSDHSKSASISELAVSAVLEVTSLELQDSEARRAIVAALLPMCR